MKSNASVYKLREVQRDIKSDGMEYDLEQVTEMRSIAGFLFNRLKKIEVVKIIEGKENVKKG